MSADSQIISSYHKNTIMASATSSGYRQGILVDRMRRFFRSQLPDYQDHRIQSIYSEAIPQDRNLPPGSIAFRRSHFPAYSPLHSLRDSNGVDRIIADVPLPGHVLGRIVPMRTFIPHENAKLWQEKDLGSTDMLPLFFVNQDLSIGLPLLDHECPTELLNKERLLPPRTSLKIKLGWPGYADEERQVQYRKKAGQGDGAVEIAIERFTMLVRGAVLNFIADAENNLHKLNSGRLRLENDLESSKWRIGVGPGKISARDVIILGVYFVSPGAAMPLLRIRDGFAFSGETVE